MWCRDFVLCLKFCFPFCIQETRQEQLAHIQEDPAVPPSLLATIQGPPATEEAAAGESGSGASAGGGGGVESGGSDDQKERASQRAPSGSTQKAGAESQMSEDTKKFLAFAETHRTVLNQVP